MNKRISQSTRSWSNFRRSKKVELTSSSIVNHNSLGKDDLNEGQPCDEVAKTGHLDCELEPQQQAIKSGPRLGKDRREERSPRKNQSSHLNTPTESYAGTSSAKLWDLLWLTPSSHHTESGSPVNSPPRSNARMACMGHGAPYLDRPDPARLWMNNNTSPRPSNVPFTVAPLTLVSPRGGVGSGYVGERIGRIYQAIFPRDVGKLAAGEQSHSKFMISGLLSPEF